MQRIMVIAALMLMFGAAFVLYALKYDTRVMADRVRALDERIEALNAEIVVERAELANLARPDRLDRLAAKFTKLAPVAPQQLGAITDIPLRSELAVLADPLAAETAAEPAAALPDSAATGSSP